MGADLNNRSGLHVPIVLLLILSAVPFAGPLWRGEVFTFRDHFDYFIPLRSFTAASLSGGELPLWNPFNGSGERWLANPQTGVFYPPSWVFLLLPFAGAYVVYLQMHVFILGLGGFLLFQRWASRQAALIAAAALMLCGPTLSLLDISNNLSSFAWMPLVIRAALRRRDPGPRPPLSADVVVLTLMFLAGEPFLAAVGALLYAIIVGSAREFRALVVVAVLSILLSSAQLLPFLEILQGSDRMAGGAAVRQSMAARDWLASVVPPVDPVSGGGALELSQRYISSIYLGLPIVFAAVAAAATARRLDRFRQIAVAGWMAIFLSAVIVSAGKSFPLIGSLWLSLPIDLTRYPSRLTCLAALAVVALSAIGLDVLAERSRAWRAGALALAVAVCGAAILLFFSSPPGVWRVSVMLLWLAILGGLPFLRPRVFAAPLFLLPLFALDFSIAAAPLLKSGSPPARIEPYARLVRTPYKLTRLLSRSDRLQSEEDRRRWLSGYLNLLTGCFDAGSPAPVVPARYLRLHDAAVAEPRPDVVDFLTVGYFATARKVEHSAFEPLAQIDEVTLFRNRNVRPVAQMWAHYRIETDAASNVEALIRKEYDANDEVRVSCRPGEDCMVPPVTAGAEGRTAAVASFPSLNEISVRVLLPQRSVMTISQLDAPGWNVEIDGTAAQALVANGLFRAVAVPEGPHRVSWKYRPRSLMIGVVLSTIALVVMTGEVLAVCRRRRRGVFS